MKIEIDVYFFEQALQVWGVLADDISSDVEKLQRISTYLEMEYERGLRHGAYNENRD